MKAPISFRRARVAHAALALAFAAAALSAPAQAKPSAAPTAAVPQAAAPAAPAVPATLQEASARLATAQTSAEYAAMLDAFSSVLPPSDSLSLLKQGLASSDAQAPSNADARSRLLVKAGDLALLLGLFGDAAASYLEAASLLAAPAVSGASNARSASSGRIAQASAAMLLRAARCELAAGDTDKALDITARLILGSDDPDVSASSRLVGAWALALQGRSAEASSLAVSLTQGSVPPERRREARFIQWLCAAADEKAKAASTLASEFPGSPEALIASGAAATPPLPHWYLGGLPDVASSRAASPAAAAGSATPQTAASNAAPQTAASGGTAAAPTASPGGATPAPSVAAAPGAPRGRRLQVGYFSIEENARILRDELAFKGFAATIEASTRVSASGAAEEKRWIVTVDAAKDVAKTRQALKDAGYEAYIIE